MSFLDLTLLFAVSLLTAGLQDAMADEPEELDGWVETIETSTPLLSMSRLGGVCADDKGNVYASNFNGEVWKIAPTGDVTLLANTLRGTSGNTIDRQGRLLQAVNVEGRIVRFSADGKMETFASGIPSPIGLVVDTESTVYVCSCSENALYRVTPEGKVSVFSKSELFDCPNGIVIGPDRCFYIVNYNDDVVIRVDRKGVAKAWRTLPDGGNAHIAFLRDSFFVTKIATHKIYRVTMGGEVLLFAGTGKRGLDDGLAEEATFAHPNGIAVSAGKDALIVNNIDGSWKTGEKCHLILRRVLVE